MLTQYKWTWFVSGSSWPNINEICLFQAPVTFKVMVPKADDKPEWKLKGQMLTYTLPLTDSVSTNVNFQPFSWLC